MRSSDGGAGLLYYDSLRLRCLVRADACKPYIVPSPTCARQAASVRVMRTRPLTGVRRLLQDLNTDEELANVAAVSAGNNKEIGDMIAKAMQRVGRQVRHRR